MEWKLHSTERISSNICKAVGICQILSKWWLELFVIMGPTTFELWFLPTVTLSPRLWLHSALLALLPSDSVFSFLMICWLLLLCESSIHSVPFFHFLLYPWPISPTTISLNSTPWASRRLYPQSLFRVPTSLPQPSSQSLINQYFQYRWSVNTNVKSGLHGKCKFYFLELCGVWESFSWIFSIDSWLSPGMQSPRIWRANCTLKTCTLNGSMKILLCA